MRVDRFIACDVITVAPDDDLVTAAKLMRKQHVGFLVVTHQDAGRQRPLGVLSDRDITIECVAEDLNPRNIKVADIMAADPVLAGADEDLEGLLTRMASAGVRRAPVVDNEGVLVGVVSFDDLLQAIDGMLGNIALAAVQQRCNETRLRSHTSSA